MKKNTQIFTYLFFVLIFTKTYADNPPTFGDDVVDNPVAPINNYLTYALLVAAALGWYFFRKVAHKKA
jgi:hypothetical protein